MQRRSTVRTFAALAVAFCVLAWQVQAGVGRTHDESPAFSPLYERRLEIGLENLESPPGLIRTAHLERVNRPVETPASANPLSVCLASGCLGSVCFGSACAGSACFGSACSGSTCGGSGCSGSACGGSACVNSGCAGSACVGSTCLGSLCLTSTCLGSACMATRCAGCPRPLAADPRG